MNPALPFILLAWIGRFFSHVLTHKDSGISPTNRGKRLAFHTFVLFPLSLLIGAVLMAGGGLLALNYIVLPAVGM